MTKTATLKPCPFCGGQPLPCQNIAHGPMYWVLCEKCHACPGDRPSEAEAADTWNSRASDSNCAQMLTALREVEEVLSLVARPKMAVLAHRQAVGDLGLQIGYGALMSTASALWREYLTNSSIGVPGGEFVAGPCQATVTILLQKVRAAIDADSQSVERQA